MIEPAGTGRAIRLRIRLQPGAAADEVVGAHGDQLRIRIAAPPVDDRANERLIEFLCEILAIPRRAIVILAGHASRSKLVHVDGIDVVAAARRLGVER